MTLNSKEKKVHENKKTRKRNRSLLVMAALVAAVTTYFLILPTIAWNGNLVCEMKEHKHDESCYEKVVTDKKQICDKDHEHSDECYEIIEEERLICGKEEHQHTQECFDAPAPEKGYYCNLPEHQHTDECYFENGQLKCTLEEHEHTLECKSDKTADIETEKEWKESFAEVELTGNYAEDTLAIAETQLDYAESEKNFEAAEAKKGTEEERLADEDGLIKNGYTRYGQWAEDPYADWNALFIEFCASYAEVEDFVFDTDYEKWIDKLSDKKVNLYNEAKNYQPEKGDIVFLENKDEEYRVALVSKVITGDSDNSDKIKVIEADKDNKVANATYDCDGEEIIGYAKLPENPDFADESKAETDAKSSANGNSDAADSKEADIDEGKVADTDTSKTKDAEISEPVADSEEPVRKMIRAEINTALGNRFASLLSLAPNGLFDYKKTIDYLGDGEANSDTDLTGTDYYRQYLDVALTGTGSTGGSSTQGTDYLIAVDKTYSMNNTFGDGMTRGEAVSRILNGNTSSATSDGLITQLLKENPNNKVAVVKYTVEGVKEWPTLKEQIVNLALGWTSLPAQSNIGPYVDVTPSARGTTTDYVSPIWRATEILSESSVSNDGNKKVLIFLSDGDPNTNPKYRSSTGKYDIDGSFYGTASTIRSMIFDAFTDLQNAVPDLDVHTIAIDYNPATDILSEMARQAQGYYYVANSFTDLQRQLNTIVSAYEEPSTSNAKQLRIVDNLSQYVELNSSNLDLKVKKVKVDGSKPDVVIWQGELGSGNNVGSAVQGYEGIVDAVTFNGSSGSAGNGTVSVVFNADYEMEYGYKYEVSYNLKVTDAAKNAYAGDENNYTATGGANTDYDSNATSSGKRGFPSNQSASVAFNNNGTPVSETYDHPVIQAGNEPLPKEPPTGIRKLVVNKVWNDEKSTHNPVTVRLLYDGEKTGKSLTLSDSNNWTGEFTGLGEEANGSFLYSVDEVVVDGYRATVGDVKHVDAAPGKDYYVPVAGNSFTAGKSYVLLNGNRIAYRSSTTAIGAKTANLVNQSISIGGTQYASYIPADDIGTSDVWTATASTTTNGQFYLSNGNYYIRNNDTILTSGTKNATSLNIDSNGRIRFYNSEYYLYRSSTDSSFSRKKSNTTSFTLYEKKTGDPIPAYYQVTVTNTPMTHVAPDDPSFGINLDDNMSKTIDYLGDEGVNNDTSLTGKNNYRLYLNFDSKTIIKSKDILFIIDGTSSMDTKNYDANNYTPATVLDEVMNGTVTSDSSAYYETRTVNGRSTRVKTMGYNENLVLNATRADDGLLYNLFNGSPNSRIAITSFANSATTRLNWTSKAGMPNEAATPKDAVVFVNHEGTGTNYDLGYQYARNNLINPVKNLNRDTILVFLTDGRPNYRYMPGQTCGTDEGVNAARDTLNGILANNPQISESYIVGFTKDAISVEGATTETPLERMARETGSVFYPAEDKTALLEALKASSGLTTEVNFYPNAIYDKLSDYVKFADQKDLIVKVNDLEGNPDVVLWDENGPTAGNTYNGKPVIKNVILDDVTGEIKVIFNDDNKLRDREFSIGFNVSASSKAISEYTSEGYNATGDSNTDYATNKTSSRQNGFFSNASTNVEFTWYDKCYYTEYKHPVIQVVPDTKSIELIKVDRNDDEKTLKGARFDLYLKQSQSTAGAVKIPGTTDAYGSKINTEALVSDTDGKISTDDLQLGEYYLVETKSPDGYELPNRALYFNLAADKITTVDEMLSVSDDDEFTLLVKNKSGYELPNTGGAGTYLFEIIGLGIIISCILVRIKQRRKYS